MGEDEVRKFREEQAKMNEEVMAKQAKSRPTPTVEEIQIALEGGGIDDKEPDGSPEQNVHHHTVPVSTQIEVGHKLPETKAEPKPAVSTQNPVPAKPAPKV